MAQTLKAHADIKVSEASDSIVNLDDEEKLRQKLESEKRGDLVLPIVYEVFLPQAHMDYNINGKTYYTFLFGIQNQLEYASPFLDDLLKGGLRKLQDAAEGRGDVSDNLQQAARYRTIKEAIYCAGMQSTNKAKAMMSKRYSFGLSDSVLDNMIVQAQAAFKNITHRPRQIGLAAAGLLNFVLLSLYFLTPARSMLISHVGNTSLHIVLDSVIALASFYFGVLTIQTLSHNVIKNVMRKLKIKEPTSPKLGTTLYLSAGLSVLILIIVLEASKRLSLSPPAWYMTLF